jgi:hypothetical protein
MAAGLMAISIVAAWFGLPEPWRYVPLAVAVPLLGWMWSMPSV